MPTDRPMPSDELATIRRLAEQERVRHGVEGGDVGAHTLSLAALDLIETVEKLAAERDKFKAACAELDKAITWHTSCLRCSSLLDASYAETCRAEQAEQQRSEALAEVERLRELRAAAKEWWSNRFLDGDALHSDERDLGAAVDALDVSTPKQDQAGDEHPERVCRRCGGPNVRAWCAPSPLWNQVMRGGDINAADRFDGIVCPVCFAALAEEAGIAERWRFYAQRVKVELAKVTPSGRVWNEKTWLWVDAADVHRPTTFLPIGSPHKEVCRACDEPWPCADADSVETFRAAAKAVLAARSETSVEPCPDVSPVPTDEPARCPRCGGLDGTHTRRNCSVADLEHENKTLEAWVRVHRQRRRLIFREVRSVTGEMSQQTQELAEVVVDVLNREGCRYCPPGCVSCSVDADCECYEHQSVEPAALPDTNAENAL